MAVAPFATLCGDCRLFKSDLGQAAGVKIEVSDRRFTRRDRRNKIDFGSWLFDRTIGPINATIPAFAGGAGRDWPGEFDAHAAAATIKLDSDMAVADAGLETDDEVVVRLRLIVIERE